MDNGEYRAGISELLKHSTVHGLNHVYNATNRRSKLIWLLLFLLGLGGFIVNFVFIVQRYLSNPILISHLVNNEPFIWPDLTFCNPTAPFSLHQSQAAHDHWMETLTKTKDYAKVVGSRSRLFRLIQDFNTSDFELEEISITMSTVDPLKVNVGHFHNHVWFYGYTSQHSGIYLVKEYGNAGIEIDGKELNQFFSTQYIQMRNNIPCHTFQINKSRSLNTEDLNSLIFVIRFNYPSYQIINSSYLFRSIFLYVSNRDHLSETDGILMLPGFNNELIITQTRYLHNSQKQNCRKNLYIVELYDGLLTSTKRYEANYEDCKKIVSQSFYLERCKCYSPFLPIYKTSDEFPRLCLNASLYSISQLLINAECMVRVYEYHRSHGEFDRVADRECGRYKDIKCDELLYKTDQKKEMWIELWSNAFNDRRRNFIQETYQPLFKRNWQGRNYVEEMRNDVAMLVIKRASMSGDLYKEDFEYPLPELVSDMGGLMGLWLGLSVIGLFEIIEFVYLLMVRSCVLHADTMEVTETDCGPMKTMELADICEPPESNFTFKPTVVPVCYSKRYCMNNCDNHSKLLNGYLFPLDDGELARSNRCMHSIISSF